MSHPVARVRVVQPKTLRYGELDRHLVVSAAMKLAECGGIQSVTVRAVAG